jgi:hypothetical protein
MNTLLMYSQPTIAVLLLTAFRFALIQAGRYGKVMALDHIASMAQTSIQSIFVVRRVKSDWRMICVSRVVYQLPPAKLL